MGRAYRGREVLQKRTRPARQPVDCVCRCGVSARSRNVRACAKQNRAVLAVGSGSFLDDPAYAHVVVELKTELARLMAKVGTRPVTESGGRV